MILNFQGQKGDLCILSNIQNFLSYYELYCSQSWLAGALSSIGFYYTDQLRSDKNILNGIGLSFEEIFRNLQNILKVPLSKCEADQIGKLLIKQKICLSWIDEYYLDYSPYYQNAHSLSLVIIVKELKDSIIIFDNGNRCIDKNNFIQSINNAGNEVYLLDGAMIEFSKPQYLIIRNGVSQIIQNMNKYEDYDTGYNAMQHFINKIERSTDEGEIYNLYYQINRPGGLTLTRKTLAMLASELSIKYNICCLDYEEFCTHLSEEWKMIGNLLFRLSSDVSNEQLKTRILVRIQNVIGMEKEGIQRLEHIVIEMPSSEV